MTDTAPSALETTTTRKVYRRIIPGIFPIHVISYLDRANIGDAAHR